MAPAHLFALVHQLKSQLKCKLKHHHYPCYPLRWVISGDWVFHNKIWDIQSDLFRQDDDDAYFIFHCIYLCHPTLLHDLFNAFHNFYIFNVHPLSLFLFRYQGISNSVHICMLFLSPEHSRFEIGAMQGQWRVCGWAGNWYRNDGMRICPRVSRENPLHWKHTHSNRIIAESESNTTENRKHNEEM